MSELTLEQARVCIERGIKRAQELGFKVAIVVVDGGRIMGAVGVSGAVPADNDHAIADAAAGHPTVPSSH